MSGHGMTGEKKATDGKPVRTLRLNSSLVIEATEPLTEEEAELVKALGGFDDEPEPPLEPEKP